MSEAVNTDHRAAPEAASRKPPGSMSARARLRAAAGSPLLGTSLLAVALLVSLWLSLGFGSVDISLGDASRSLWRSLSGESDLASRVVMQVRLPRAILAALVGSLLALCGVIMQAFFRNAMAEPYLVGVSSGAALGAVLAMLLGWSVRIGWFSTVPLFAFLFGLATVALVYAIHARRRFSPGALLITGIAISSAVSAVVALLLVTSEKSVQDVLFWLLGSLSTARWTHVAIVAPYAIVGLAASIALARDLDLLLWGDITGAALGVRIGRTRGILLAAASLMTAACVAVCGILGFVGIMVPHLARGLTGSAHRRLIPAAMLLGGLLLVWADVLARTLRAPTELPLGAITAIVGAPFLVYLCGSGRRQEGWLS